MTWRLIYATQAAKSLRALPLADLGRIISALDTMQDDLLAGDVKALTDYLLAFRRRVGNYCILFDIDPAKHVLLMPAVPIVLAA